MQRDIMDGGRAIDATYAENEKQQAQLFLSQKYNRLNMKKQTQF